MGKSINEIEQIYKNNKNNKRLIMLICRYYLYFLDNQKIEYLQKAYFIIEEYLKINKTNLDMILAICFFSLELNDKESSEKYFNIISKFKKYLKSNDKIRYSFYMYLIALQKYNKNKNISKYIKIIEAYNKENSKEINLILLDLKFRNDDLDREVDFGEKFYNKNSFFFNLIFYKILDKSPKFLIINKQLFKKHIKWSFNNQLNILNSLNKYRPQLDFDFKQDNFNTIFYEKYNYDIVLKKLVEIYIQNNKLTKTSFSFYKEAINRQIDLEGLAFNYIKGCYKFKVEEIGLYPINQFLASREMDFNIVAFVYHIILTNPKYSQIIQENSTKILQYGSYFLEKKYTGRFYYSIYKYMLENLTDKKELENKIIEMIYPIYYKYEMTVFNNSAKYVYIKNNELTDIKKYEILDKRVYITAISNDFSYYILDENNKELITSDIKIEKLIEDDDNKLALKFYSKNLIDKLTLINLGKYFLTLKKIPSNVNSILLKILNIEDLAPKFKTKILQLIGNSYFENFEYENANIYYKKISEKDLENKYINNILITYVNCSEYEKAIDIIKKKSHFLSDAVLYIALRSISEFEQYDFKIAPFVYEMLMKGKIDNLFIEILINNYKGSLSEWLNIRNTLKNMGVVRKKLDEHILKTAIYMQSLDSEIEKIFFDIFEDDLENILIEDFLNYCIYQAIFNNYEFLDKTINIMENIFMNYEYENLGYGLGHIYIYQNFDIQDKAQIFEKIVSNMEKARINFTIFDENKNKLKNYAYILKNTPFIYKSFPDKDIYIFYKNLNDESYKSVKLKYLKFGLYICTLPIFFGEEIEYYFSENMNTGSILTKKYTKLNNYNEIFEEETDKYFKINNGIIYSYEGKYQLMQDLIEDIILQDYDLKGKIL